VDFFVMFSSRRKRFEKSSMRDFCDEDDEDEE
jgi:hypothetical protein